MLDMTAVIVALITAVIAPVAVLVVRAWAERQRDKFNKPFSNMLPKIQEVFNILNQVVAMEGCARAIVLKSENGGGRPRLGSELYSSVLYEVYGPNRKPVRSSWFRQLLDQGYIKVLSELIAAPGGQLTVVPEAFADSSVRDVYTADGVDTIKLATLAEKENCYLYASFTFAHRQGLLSAEERLALQEAVNKLRALFKEFEA